MLNRETAGVLYPVTLNAAEIHDTESIEAYSDSSPMLGGLLWLDFGVVLPIAALGGWIHRRQSRRLLIRYGMVASLTVVAFYVVARYRHPLVPILLLFSAAGLGALLDTRRASAPKPVGGRPARGNAHKPPASRQPLSPQGWSREWIPGLAAAGLPAVVTHLPMKVVHDETYINLGAILVQTGGRAADAVPVLLRAVAGAPGRWLQT